MNPELVSFDAAGTLIKINWHPARFAIECAAAIGISLDAQPATEVYDRMLGSRWKDYCRTNQTRDDKACDLFWRTLAEDWLLEVGGDSRKSNELIEMAQTRLYGPAQTAFTLYSDVLPALEKLSRSGYRMVLLSNWDYSLHRVAASLGMATFFEHVFASLQEGVEKPDPRLFALVWEKAGVSPQNVVHIGDNPYDDFEGARSAGMKALLLDRGLERSQPPRLNSLADLDGGFAWFD